jgi:DNA modification methylase
MIMGGSSEGSRTTQPRSRSLLAEIPIRNHLRAGEAVYDPFAGSGTTLVAAQTLGRSCYGMEIEPRFVQVTIERWQGLTGQAAERIDG